MAVPHGGTIGKRYWVRANGVMAAESETRRQIIVTCDSGRAARVLWVLSTQWKSLHLDDQLIAHCMKYAAHN